MNIKKILSNSTQVWIILVTIWFISSLSDNIWLVLDNSIPPWDQSNHLTKSVQYLHALEYPNFFNSEWWRSFWSISSKYPPLTYIVAALFQKIFGVGNDSALTTNILYNGVLILAIYVLGKVLFNHQIGLWSAGLSMLFPRLYQSRLQFLIDTPLMTLTVLCFCCLTIWKLQKINYKQWLWTVIFGICWGLALLTKQSVMFFLLIPLLWLAIGYIFKRKWQRILQLTISLIISSVIWFPWYRTNWIYLFSTINNSNTIPASYEGDPPLNTLAAWTYYWQDLPSAVTWILLVIPLVGLILNWLGMFPDNKQKIETSKLRQGIVWLAIYFIGSYLICSSIFNKDTRYIMSYLPILAIFLAYGLLQWRAKWEPVRWITLGLAFLVMCTNLFPIPGTDKISLILSGGGLFHPYLDKNITNSELIKTVQLTSPYQVSNLGVIVNTDFFNHNTINYYGQVADFQVYGRELGNKEKDIEQDQKYFDWFVTKTGDNGFARKPQLSLAKKLEANVNFSTIKTWYLSDKNILTLYHRQVPSVIVKKILNTNINTSKKVNLEEVKIPQRIPSGFPVPVTYEWSGSWKELKSGLVLLNWEPIQKKKQSKILDEYWIHDHGIGAGMLYGNYPEEQTFKVIENFGMMVPKNLPSGDYRLTGIYLNRNTKETYPITISNVNITIDNDASPMPSFPLDLVTRLRQLSLNLAQGIEGLDPIFEQVDRINQYDPIQDYLKQTEESLTYRLNHYPEKYELEWTYGLVLSHVLQENPKGAITNLKKSIKLDPNNPYNYAYLAFVYLYNWQPKAAEIPLKYALQLKPNSKEFQILDGISAVMQGNLFKGWRVLSPLL
ncbi:phospholipid carrier-dependent glycosyltransferase [Cyanobacterium sp. uoEpiScrs1]|uniref:phospholipid carrier-dependent glycosyltransferase n=1 Tax=Cyanobacterium sp. uoEpiScrs1 TaxID=2976343 RepID=UPI00226AC41E|nr:phospholipid carrier-dependent glycosyltransferase [Cyanobacterium sp. uoEpiScrs1]